MKSGRPHIFDAFKLLQCISRISYWITKLVKDINNLVIVPFLGLFVDMAQVEIFDVLEIWTSPLFQAEIFYLFLILVVAINMNSRSLG